jgi:Ca2+-binding EF-hand superfamily protein
MRLRHLLGLALLGLSAWLTLPTGALGQFRGKGNFPPGGGFPGGGFPGGGFQGGGFPGGGRMPGGGMMGGDLSGMFDRLARGRPYFLINDTSSLRGPLMQFAQERGITNGQITREQFTQFTEKMKTQMTQGGFGQVARQPFVSAPGGFTPGGFSPSGFSGVPGQFPGANPIDMMGQWAEGEFRRRDQNGDNQLNQDEMPDSLRQDLNRWDSNRDGLIDQGEYRGYMLSRFGQDNQQANPVTIILEEELDLRPTVYRAGKMPKEPRWLEELDTDKDGQVGLYEWRRGGKDLDDFRTYDPNDDGFITAEEALRVYAGKKANGSTSVASSDGRGERPSFMNREGGSKMSKEDWTKMREEWAKKKDGFGEFKKRN